jgi:signal transduction histidine kinase
MDDLKLDYDTQINLYRLVQEALNNIKKHAQARDVKIRMVASHPHIILRIEDDGKGFDVNQCLREASKQAHMGLHSMQERVNLLDGNIKIQSRPMEGTRIVVEIPCRIEKGAAAFKKTG